METVAPFDWRDRVVELCRMLPSQLLDHPLQHKIHPPVQQDVLRGVLGDVGIADVLRIYRSPQTQHWTTIDGHLRKSLGERPWPCIVLDVDDTEAAYLLALGDEVTLLHQKDQAKLTHLLAEVQSEQTAVQSLLERLRTMPPVQPVYSPMMTPTSLVSRPVFSEDMEQAADKIQTSIERQQVLVAIVCPHCLRDFAVNPEELLA